MTDGKNFVAINYIDCTADYVERFEELFSTRAGAIDKLEGFQYMHVLKPKETGDSYRVVSYWEFEDNIKPRTKSPAILEGHKRAFAHMAKAKEEGKTTPMKSTFKVYDIISR